MKGMIEVGESTHFLKSFHFFSLASNSLTAFSYSSTVTSGYDTSASSSAKSACARSERRFVVGGGREDQNRRRIEDETISKRREEKKGGVRCAVCSSLTFLAFARCSWGGRSFSLMNFCLNGLNALTP